ncbi:hypothetical protein [Botrimarina hoheduenensis]|uniref:Transmembrane protein n=1 Tax=Botrimarina hoheduenensis TaxID=2528000 RepID=A0A5C5WB33_9BACT|nr:hypothetical protein [Botrimarina hoheduenensis]TWT47375.1 hypothetical protein Pla111_09880 [Botrimarina hoheduenensis]
MKSSSPKPVASRMRGIALGSLLLGLLALAASAFTPESRLRTVPWSPADAQAHQQASEELHRLSLVPAEGKASQDALRAARVSFADLDNRLVEAADAPRRWRAALRWGGALLSLCGAAYLLAGQS